jgi:hypothetical protein
MKLKIGIAALAVALISSGAAQAADVFGRGSTKDAPDNYSAVVSSWTGFIVGGMVGGTFNTTKLDYADNISGLPCTDLDVGAGADGISTVGVHFGGLLGYQRQLGRIVLGVEGWGGWSNAESEITASAKGDLMFIKGIDETFKAGFEQDYWYAGYGKVGYDLGGGLLVSGLLGYKQVHLEGSGALKGWDDEVGGVSGGLLVEKMFDNRLIIGAYGTYTAFEDKEYAIGKAGSIKANMDGFDVGLRAAVKF